MPINFGRKGIGLGSYWDGKTRTVNVYTSTWILNNAGQVIGGIQDLTVGSRRNTTVVRILDGYQGGKIIDQIPSPEDITLRARSVMFYLTNEYATVERPEVNFGSAKAGEVLKYTNSEKAAYFGATALDRITSGSSYSIAPGTFLSMQFVPFDIWNVFYNPTIKQGFALIFYDCFITDYSFSLRVENAIVAEDVSMRPTTWEITYDLTGNETISNFLSEIDRSINIFNAVKG